MHTYVISDIHGCYDEFLSMLERIGFSEADRLILAGDYIDRGNQSYEMLWWLERCPQNVVLLRGNHEEEFVAYIDLMLSVDRREELGTDFSSLRSTWTASCSSTMRFRGEWISYAMRIRQG